MLRARRKEDDYLSWCRATSAGVAVGLSRFRSPRTREGGRCLSSTSKIQQITEKKPAGEAGGASDAPSYPPPPRGREPPSSRGGRKLFAETITITESHEVPRITTLSWCASQVWLGGALRIEVRRSDIKSRLGFRNQRWRNLLGGNKEKGRDSDADVKDKLKAESGETFPALSQEEVE
ncbi:hypothetical protein THAOC_30570, partial [Thalassiosira oceanica]